MLVLDCRFGVYWLGLLCCGFELVDCLFVPGLIVLMYSFALLCVLFSCLI